MTFSKLAEYFEKLEQTSSRLILIDILAELFNKVESIEISKVIYLISGRVAPFYEPLEIGMAEKSVAGAVAKAYDVKREEVLKEYGKVGDLGLVAEKLSSLRMQGSKKQISNMDSRLRGNDKTTVTEVFNTLTEIAKTTGAGTVEKKQGLLVGLLQKLDSISAKHLVRIPLGVSRLGIGDPTVLDGLAKAKLGDKSNRKLLENAYNKTSDLGLIAETLFKGGLKAVQRLDVFLGRPIRSQLAERLPDAKTILEKMEGRVHVQYKYDGFRCITGYTPIYIKNKGITAVRDIQVGDAVLTKTGSFKVLLAKNRRTIKKGEKLFKFQTYLGEEVKISEGHPILCWVDKKELWRSIEDVKAGDEVIFPLPKFPLNNPHPAPKKLELQTISGYKKTFNLDESLYRFLGFWIGDGFTHVSKQNFKQFLQGWIESDGSVDKDGVTKIVTKERDLAAFAQLIALSHGIIAGLHYIRIKKAIRGTQDKTYYQLVIPKTTRKARVENGRVVIKVMRNEEIKRPDSRTQLYDLQVEGDESFCVPMVTLHNCQIHKDGDNIRLFSRNLEETTNMMPDIIAGTLKQVKAKTAILDSEALAFNPVSEEFLPFQETTKRRRKYNIAEMAIKLPLKAFVFDIMYLNGKSLVNEPLESRIKSLKSCIEDEQVLIPQPGEITGKIERIEELFNDALTKGLEGLIIKRPDSKYEAGARNFNWVKLKRHSAGELKDTIDCVILGYIFGKGKRATFGAGALLVGVYDESQDEFVTVSKIGTGLTDEEWREIHRRADKIKVDHKPARVNSILTPSVWIKPEIVIEVLADEITKSPIHTAGMDRAGLPAGRQGYALRFPRMVKFREADKKAEDATTVKELIEMYEQQFKK